MKITPNSPPLSLNSFNNIPDGDIFAKGEVDNSPEGIYMTDSRIGDKMLWVAKKGYAGDWVIYIHWAENGYGYVSHSGDKVITKTNIKKLVPCTDDVFSLYRY